MSRYCCEGCDNGNECHKAPAGPAATGERPEHTHTWSLGCWPTCPAWPAPHGPKLHTAPVAATPTCQAHGAPILIGGSCAECMADAP